MRKRSELRVSQLAAYEKAMATPYCMFGMGMGLGKTGTALTVIRDLLDTFRVCHVLVIAPLLVAEETWPEEIEAWEHTSVLDYEVLTGPAERRENRARRLPEVSIINTENVGWLVDFWGDDWPYDMVVIDEISRFKNPSKRTKPTKAAIQKIIDDTMKRLPKDMHPQEVELEVAKAVKKAPRNPTRFGSLCKVRKRIARMLGLTGTMAPNGLLDIWSQFYLLDLGQRLGTTYHAYRTRFFESDYMGFKYSLRPGAFEQIVERISDITISMKTEDYVDMPPVLHNTVKVRLPEKVMTKYKAFERTMLLEEHDIEAVNNGVLTGKLLQLCIAEGTEVLCRRGWVPIEQVSSTDEVWDGVEYVSTDGVIYKGQSNVVTCFGVDMTRGHLVLTKSGWETAERILNGDAAEGLDREPVRLPDSYAPGRDSEEQGLNLAVPMRMREGGPSAEYVPPVETPWLEKILRVSSWGDAGRRLGVARHDRKPAMGDLAGPEAALSGPEGQGLQELWRKGYRYARYLVQLVQRILDGCTGWLLRRVEFGSAEQRPGVQQGELPVGDELRAAAQHTGESVDRHAVGPDDGGRGSGALGAEIHNSACSGDQVRVLGRGTVPPREAKVAVFDLVNCGPRNRFVVRGTDGPLIVHNCNGSVYDEDGNVVEIHSLKLEALDRVIEEANGAPVLVAYSYQFDLDKLRKRYPKAEVVGEAANLQKRWNNGEIPILLAHPASAGHGLNLQYGGCITVWYGLNWSLELYQQLNKRLHRPGQKETVVIHHIVAEGTVDERVMEVLPEKDATQDALVEATKYRRT